MMQALGLIEGLLENENINWKKFQRYVEEKIFFLYFDLENRENGEDLFVIINTTGEPLTATENLKPILLGALKDNEELNKQWEEREEFFWQNKRKFEHEADDGHRDFITWYIRANNQSDDVQIFKYFKEIIEDKNKSLVEELKRIHTYFEKLKTLLDYLDKDTGIKDVFHSVRLKTKNDINPLVYLRNFTFRDDKRLEQQQNILIPLLCFLVKISDERDTVYQFIRRLRKNYYDKHMEYRDGKYVDWRHILNIIMLKNNLEDILTFSPEKSVKLLSIQSVEDNSDYWYNAEEKIKNSF